MYYLLKKSHNGGLFILKNLFLFLVFILSSSSLYADQLIIEPDMGRAPIENLINQAHQSLNLVMYGFTDKQLLDDLIDQKKRGRTLQIILESKPYKFENENQKTMQILDFNKVAWHGNVPPFRLIHQKTLIIDGHKALVMTFNFTRSSFNRERNFAILIENPQQVKEIQAVFSADWNHKPALYYTPNLIYSPNNSRDKLIELISTAKHSINVYAQSISDYKIVGALAKAARYGVKVNILTSSSLRSKQADYLTKTGVIIHRSNQYYIHAKVFIFDDQKAVIGSINLTRASLDDNRELAVVTQDSKIIKQLISTFSSDWSRSDAAPENNLSESISTSVENDEFTHLLHQFVNKTYRHFKKQNSHTKKNRHKNSQSLVQY